MPLLCLGWHTISVLIPKEGDQTRSAHQGEVLGDGIQWNAGHLQVTLTPKHVPVRTQGGTLIPIHVMEEPVPTLAHARAA